MTFLFTGARWKAAAPVYRWVGAFTAILLVGGVTAIAVAMPRITESEMAARAYVEALTALDLKRAEQHALGEALVQVRKLEAAPGTLPSQVVSSSWVTEERKAWSTVRGRVETLSTAGQRDLQWLEFTLVKTGGSWYVVRMRSLPPTYIGRRAARHSFPVGDLSMPPPVKQLLTRFLLDVIESPQALETYLAGPALQAWLRSVPLLGPGGLYRDIEVGNAHVLTAGKEMIRVQGSYVLEGRFSQALFTLAKLSDGSWRIVEVINLADS